MNFLDIINKCLLELNYKQVNAFSELIKNDHKRIINILNIINKEICSIEKWEFLLRRKSLTLDANTQEVENTVNGRIYYLFIDNERYDYSINIEPFLKNNPKPRTYTCLGNKLLFPKFNETKTIDIIYFTNNCVVDVSNEEKTDFETSTDKTLIPMPFAEALLVYGTCLRLKANTGHFKFPYWQGMYYEALRNLKSKSSNSTQNAPRVNIFRK